MTEKNKDEEIKVPGQVKPSWDEISEGLDQLLTPKEEQNDEP